MNTSSRARENVLRILSVVLECDEQSKHVRLTIVRPLSNTMNVNLTL